MTTLVKVKSGLCRGRNFKNKIFEATHKIELRPGKHGTFLKLYNKDNVEFPQQLVRIYTKADDFEILNYENEQKVDSTLSYQKPIISDEELYKSIRIKFDIMKKLIHGCATGNLKGLTFTGGAGIGKTHNAQQWLEEHGYSPVIFENDSSSSSEDDEAKILADMANAIAEDVPQKYYVVVKGRVTPLGLYKTLFDHKDKIIMFDDCDSILQEPISLNILKAALDTYERRMICYNSRAVGSQGLPRKFEFTGAIIFISNINFDYTKTSAKLKPHVDAIMSRCHYLNLDMNSKREKLLRIKQVIKENDLFFRYPNLTDENKSQIIDYIDVNQNRLREISLRTALKLADICLVNKGQDWHQMADATCLIKESVNEEN